ncbi:glycosyltransferase [Frigidibacter sp. MR17.24]|uniref:glycosyltransferase n=1 Tax=Frigidibacter sp. MR17.24 TaxID=3127345 RepID=UPI003012A09E
MTTPGLVRGWRIGLVCPALPSHLAVFEALAQGLRDRGHHPEFLLEPGVALPGPTPRRAVPGGRAFGRRLPFLGQILSGAERTDRLYRAGTALARDLDLVIADQMEPAGALIARRLGLPLVAVAAALPLEPEPGLPLPFLDWPHDPGPDGVRRARGGAMVARLLLWPHRRVIRRHSDGAWDTLEACLPPRPTLAQTIPGFEPPRPVSGGRLHLLGPLRPPGPLPPLPDDIRPDPARPLVYVSLGTLFGGRRRLLLRAARAARAAGAQVLVSTGGAPEGGAALGEAADWVRRFVPQEAVLARADLCVTHAGLNTALECLRHGVPMLALPLAFDQPGVAMRIARSGTGIALPRHRRGAAALRAATARLLADPGFRARARAFRDAATGWPGLPGALAAIDAAIAEATEDARGARK